MQTAPFPFDPLLAFADWFLRNGITNLRPPALAIWNYGKVISFILYKKTPFQVELVILPPNTDGLDGLIEEHSHPNVDSVEVLLNGKITFILEGKRTASDAEINAIAPDGASGLCGGMVRVGPGIKHGAHVGPEGGAFLSIQYWLNGQPKTVGHDWEGHSMGPLHDKVLNPTKEK